MPCCCSVAQSCLTLCDPMGCSTSCLLMKFSLSFTISWRSLRFMSIESVMSSNHLVLKEFTEKVKSIGYTKTRIQRNLKYLAPTSTGHNKHSPTFNQIWCKFSHQRSICTCSKLLQSCLTLCDHTDCSPPGSSIHAILQASILA